jgi:methionyl-tRNA formyltransferase
MKNILIGSVGSTKAVLEEMISSSFPLEMVFSLDEKYSENVSGYYPIHDIAVNNKIAFTKFKKINEQHNIEIIKEIKPDYIFVVGLSQLIGNEILSAASKGVIGFHPTPLPMFRGRAPMVWQMLLGVRETKCTMFFIDNGIDSGDIIAQEPYIIEETDYAGDVTKKLLAAISKMTKNTLNQIINNNVHRIKQDESKATYLLLRTPEDGLIDWNETSDKIHRLIRAVSKPYPGAFANYKGLHKVIFWRADIIRDNKYIGIPGQIANITEKGLEIVCKDGLLRVYEYSNIDEVKLTVGHKFK